MKRTLAPFLCTLALAGAVAWMLPGCESTYEDRRPDPSSILPGDVGLQSKDLIEMSDKMAADILKINEIAMSPTKITIVMTGIDNQMQSEPGRDMTIYVARIRAKLNTYARDRLAFVEKKATTEGLQNQELGGPADPFGEASRGYNPNAAPTRLLPQYALKGVFMDLPNRQSRYFLCTFQLTRLSGPTAGELVWEGHYEVRTAD